VQRVVHEAVIDMYSDQSAQVILRLAVRTGADGRPYFAPVQCCILWEYVESEAHAKSGSRGLI
jgi:hypothetical protein